MPDYDGSSTIGPGTGTLVLHGGSSRGLTAQFRQFFIDLFRNQVSPVLVEIPTALRADQLQRFITTFKAKPNHRLLHTTDRDEADSDVFVEPLRQASAVWMTGGRQWRLAKSYRGTAVEREIKALLARGGIVGGSSAGASIQASYLIRAKEGDEHNPDGDNSIVMVSRNDKGFALLPNSAIDQHVIKKHREADLQEVVAAFPEILGIGIDEDTAIIIKRNIFTVIGESQVFIHDGTKPYYPLMPGQRFNLKTRSII